MVTLKDILDLTWTVTQITLYLREPEHEKLIKEYVIGEGCNEENATVHQKYLINKGELEMIDKNINYFGTKKGKSVENGWGTIFKNIPAELLDKEVTHFSQSSRGGWDGTELLIHVKNSNDVWEDIKAGKGIPKTITK